MRVLVIAPFYLLGASMSDKLKIIALLQKTHDAVYDIDHILGQICITKETAVPLREVLKHLGMADAYLTTVLEHEYWR